METIPITQHSEELQEAPQTRDIVLPSESREIDVKSMPVTLSAEEIEEKFDLAYHLKHVDTIFARVFGA